MVGRLLQVAGAVSSIQLAGSLFRVREHLVQPVVAVLSAPV